MQGQGRRRTTEEAILLRAHCGIFSRMGWALFGQMGGSLALQIAAALLVAVAAPELMENGIFLWVLGVASAYILGAALFCGILSPVPAAPRQEEKHPLGPGRFLRIYVLSMGALYVSNFATLALMGLIGLIRGEPVVNPVDSIQDYPAVLNVILGCVIAPVLEELMFRGMLLRRLRPYGEKFAVFTSALCFGLFHGNLNQLFYAFALGVIFAYVAEKTGCLWQTMLLHAMVNGVSVVLIPLLELLGEAGNLLLGLFALGCIFGGVAFLIAIIREVRFAQDGYALRERQKWRLFFENPGMICFCILAGGMAASYLV